MTTDQSKKPPIFIGAAWPYANGNPHFGHVSSLIGADVLARYYRQAGHPVLFVSGSDCHGTPIAVEAEKAGISPKEFALTYHEIFRHSLIDGLSFSYDLYTTTMTDNHRVVVQELFLDLHRKDLIFKKSDQQFYCEHCKRFLPDRYVEGTCPKCGFSGGRGDQCDECGTLLNPVDLLHPRCKICGQTPIFRETEHFYLRLETLKDTLKKWMKDAKGWTSNALNFTKGFLEGELKDRAITRDLEWGVPIPLPGYDDKRIYVWFEAVTGYLSASKEWASATGDPSAWELFWKNDDVIAYYCHGKDNIPFHTIIWPAMLMGAGDLHLPNRILSTEYLTLEGKQFSKSRHWAVWIPDFLKQFDGETLRYFLLANGPESSDADFTWSQFQARVNGDLIGNLGNFIHRTISLIHRHFPDGVALPDELSRSAKALEKKSKEAFERVGERIATGHFREGIQQILELSAEGNRYLNEVEPWRTIKENPKDAEESLAVAAFLIQHLIRLLHPFLPTTAERLRLFFTDLPHIGPWEAPTAARIKVNPPVPLFKRVEDEDVEREQTKLQSVP